MSDTDDVLHVIVVDHVPTEQVVFDDDGQVIGFKIGPMDDGSNIVFDDVLGVDAINRNSAGEVETYNIGVERGRLAATVHTYQVAHGLVDS